jgi:hypothetical protein
MGFWKIIIMLVLLYVGYRFVSGAVVTATESLTQIFWWMFP